MTERGEYGSRRGRHRPEPDDYREEDEFESSGGYGGRSGYWPRPPSGGPDGYAGDRYNGGPDYGDQGFDDWRDGDPRGYREPAGYGDPHGYGEPPRYSEPPRYEDTAGGAGAGGYQDPAGYRDPGGYPDAGGYRDAGGYGQASGYGGPASAGDHWSGNSEYDGVGQGLVPYGQAGGYPPAAPYDQYGDPGSPRGRGTAPYDVDQGGTQAGWAFRPETDGYDPEPLGEAGTDPYAMPDARTFGRPDSGSFPRPDSGSFSRPDSGSFSRPDSGSFSRPDSGSFSRPDAGTFARDDSRGYRRLDPGTSGADDGYERGSAPGRSLDDSDSIRWTAGPPPKSRDERGRDDGAFGRSLPASDGYAPWHDAAPGDWDGAGNVGLLSRRFGRGGDDGPGGRGGGRSRREARGRKRRRFRGSAAFTIAIMLVAVLIGAGAFVGYSYIHRFIVDRYGDYKGAGTGKVQITVDPGSTLVGLGPTLLKQGVIMALKPYDTAAAAVPSSSVLQPGVYTLHHHMNSALAVHYLLSKTARTQVTVTIIEGTRATEIATQLAKVTGDPASAFLTVINHPPASLGIPSWAPSGVSAEGFLFPDTYSLIPHESPLDILKTMVREFNSKVASISIASAAAKVHTTPWHVLIVASMVQAEGGRIQDFPGIARVAWDRLIVGRALQFDSTVFYAKHVYGTAITLQDEKFPSPYNTYLHTGLPPGPIGNPGLDAIKATLHPSSQHYLYFITDTRTKPPYKTYFTSNYAQFLVLQRKFHV
jgi:uncharacterized YceG family protein